MLQSIILGEMSVVSRSIESVDIRKRLATNINVIRNLIDSWPLNRNNIEYWSDNIIDGIWLGNWQSAHDSLDVKNKRISLIVNATHNINDNTMIVCSRFRVPLSEKKPCNLNTLSQIEEAADVIKKHVDNNKQILVHCKNGHHRSASIVALYLIKYRNMDLYQAIEFIKTRRPTAFRRMSCFVELASLWDLIK